MSLMQPQGDSTCRRCGTLFYWPGYFSRLCPDCIAEMFTPKPKHTNDGTNDEPSATRLSDFKRELDIVRTAYQREDLKATAELKRRVRERESSIPDALGWFQIEMRKHRLGEQRAIEQLELRFGLCWLDYLLDYLDEE